jgi:hypothetical protein
MHSVNKSETYKLRFFETFFEFFNKTNIESTQFGLNVPKIYFNFGHSLKDISNDQYERLEGTNKTWIKSKTVSYTIDQTITIKPHMSVIVNWELTVVDDVKLPFTAAYDIGGSWIKDHQEIVMQFEEIRDVLRSEGLPEGHELIKKTDQKMSVKLEGEYDGTFGLHTKLTVSDRNGN